VKCHGQGHDGVVLALIGRGKNAVGKQIVVQDEDEPIF